MPACFESQKQWTGWLEANRVYGEPLHKHTHCQDCMAYYQKEMIREKRCDNPTFVCKLPVDDDSA